MDSRGIVDSGFRRGDGDSGDMELEDGSKAVPLGIDEDVLWLIEKRYVFADGSSPTLSVVLLYMPQFVRYIKSRKRSELVACNVVLGLSC